MATENNIEINELFISLKKYKWLIIGIMVFFVLLSYYLSTQIITPMYKADTTLFIGKEENDLGISLSEINRNNVLISDYKNIAESRLIINQVMKNLNISIELKKFRKRMSIEIIDDSRLFIVSYESENPRIARDVANELAEQLSIGVLEIVGVKNIKIIDKALIPDEIETPKVLKNTVLGGFIGLTIGLIVFFILFLKNDVIHDIDSVVKDLKLTLIGSIPIFTDIKSKYQDTMTLINSNSYFSEAYKMLRSNINYIKANEKCKIIMFTSSSTGEGKTTTITHLAMTMANEGKKVLLIDGDLRKPKVHRKFNLKQIPGLTSIMYNSQSLKKVVNRVLGENNLEVLTSGALPSSPDLILGSKNFKKFINDMKDEYDYILIDAPPVLYFSDPIILAQFVEGIVLVASMYETSKQDLRHTKEALDKVGANIIGLVSTKNQIDNVYKKNYYYKTF